MTEKSSEVRMWMCGTECELRPVSARGLLLAKKESREIAKEFQGDERGKKLIEAACIISAGTYENGEKVFLSGMDVLERLTAEEIFFAAEEYEAENGGTAKEKSGEKTAEREKREKSEKEFEAAESLVREKNECTAQAAESGEKSVTLEELYENKTEKTEHEEDKQAEKEHKAEKRIGERETRHASIRTSVENGENKTEEKESDEREYLGRKRAAGRKENTRPAVREMTNKAGENIRKIALSRGGRDEMEAVSGFFERDCRRYDGAFTRY